MTTASLAANLLGFSNSLAATRKTIRIRRQGNGNFTVYRETEFANGGRGYGEVAVNVSDLDEARAIAQEAA